MMDNHPLEKKIIMRYVALFVAILFVGCYNRFNDAEKSATVVSITTNSTLKYLDELLGVREYVDISNDIIVSGQVTATDESGNFYRSFVFQSDSYAAEVLVGLTSSYNLYPEGSIVVVKMEGLRISRTNGVMQIGVASEAGSYYPVDDMLHEVVVDQHIFWCENQEPAEPLLITLSELMEGEMFQSSSLHYGELVQIDGLRLDADSTEVITWSGLQQFIDSDGHTMLCNTSDYANFADEIIPTCEVSLIGILQSYTTDDTTVDRIMVKMRSLDDCQY